MPDEPTNKLVPLNGLARALMARPITPLAAPQSEITQQRPAQQLLTDEFVSQLIDAKTKGEVEDAFRSRGVDLSYQPEIGPAPKPSYRVKGGDARTKEEDEEPAVTVTGEIGPGKAGGAILRGMYRKNYPF